MRPEINKVKTTNVTANANTVVEDPLALSFAKRLKNHSKEMVFARKNIDFDNLKLMFETLTFGIEKKNKDNIGFYYNVTLKTQDRARAIALETNLTSECLFAFLRILENEKPERVRISTEHQKFSSSDLSLRIFLGNSHFTSIGILFKDILTKSLNSLETHEMKRKLMTRVLEVFETSITEFHYCHPTIYIKHNCTGFLLTHRLQKKMKNICLLLGTEWIAYSDGPGHTILHDVFYLDSNCKVCKFEYQDKAGLTLEKYKEKLEFLLPDDETRDNYFKHIEQIVLDKKKAKQNRFSSFARIRSKNLVNLNLNGDDYFKKLYKQLDNANFSIMIQGWWISPELYLLRPIKGNEQSRLDVLLKKKAAEGVKVRIMTYHEPHFFLSNNSKHTEDILSNLHPNITVIKNRHGDFSHHEKVVIIDYEVAYLGGIDLCFGRYDTCNYCLTDAATELEKQHYPGKDYSNARYKDFGNLDEPFVDQLDRNTDPRMPWHDVQSEIIGHAVKDVAFQFIQRWNFLVKSKYAGKEISMILYPEENNADFYERNLKAFGKPEDQFLRCQILRSSANWSSGLPVKECSILKGYVHMIKKSKRNIYMENQFFITSTRENIALIQNDIGKAILQRILEAVAENQEWVALIVIPLLPAFTSEVDSANGTSLRHIIARQNMSISYGPNSIFQKLRDVGIIPEKYILFTSMRTWGEIGPESKLVTSQIYVHSKVIFADNDKCIIGSANINDRSMLGDRDSEIAVFIESEMLTEIKVCGVTYFIDNTISGWMQQLLREKFGCYLDLVKIVEKQFEKYKQEAHNYARQFSLDPNSKSERIQKLLAFFHFEFAMRGVLKVECTERWKPFTTGEPSRTLPLTAYERTPFTFFAQKEHVWKISSLAGFFTYLNTSNASDSQKVDLLKRVQYLQLATLEKRKQGFDIFKPLNKTPSNTSDDLFFPPFSKELFQRAKLTDPFMFLDPTMSFVKDYWNKIAAQNTEIYRNTFSCQPDDNVQSWKEFKKNKERESPKNTEQKNALRKELQKTQGFVVLAFTKYFALEMLNNNFYFTRDLENFQRVKIIHD